MSKIYNYTFLQVLTCTDQPYMTMVFKNKALTVFHKSSSNFGWNISCSLITSWAAFWWSKWLICGLQYLHLNHINPTYPAEFYHWMLGMNSIRISNLDRLLERATCIYDCSVNTLFWKGVMKYRNVLGGFFLRIRIIKSKFYFCSLYAELDLCKSEWRWTPASYLAPT